MVKFRVPTKSSYFASESLSSLEMFKIIIKRINFIANIIGCDIFSDDFSVLKFHFLSSVGNLFGFYALSFYDIYLFRTDLVRLCFCLVTVGLGFQGLNKLYTFLVHRPQILNLCDRIEKFLTNFNHHKVNQAFEKWIIIACHVGSLLILTLAGCGFLIFVYPIIYYFFSGEKILHFGFELPMIDWHTNVGYFLNFLYSGSLFYLFIPATIASCFLTLYLIIMSFGQFEVLQVLLEELDEMILAEGNETSSDRIKSHIGLIAEIHNELVE